jgi:hypothetical protein
MDSARKVESAENGHFGARVPAIDRSDTNCYGRAGLRQKTAAATHLGSRSSIARRLLAPAACAVVLGCGPVEYINQVGNRAASAVSAAKLASAERYAPYEYTAAAEYLHKAREEAGYAEYEDAIDYGQKAEELANRARAIALQRMAKEAENAHYQPKTQNEEPAPPDDPATAAAKQRARERGAQAPGTP